ncbi:MAG TPA: hypothetical protein VJ820_10845, partial [Propionibacteriaceae bacterium]|nr:hypothetical protein [Propionibacteriaceae bacterium]
MARDLALQPLQPHRHLDGERPARVQRRRRLTINNTAGVTDVLVNGSDHVFIDRGAGLELTDVRFPCERDLRRLAQHLAVSVGRRLDDA